MSSSPSAPTYDVRLLHDCRVPMRDGISLSADVYLPLGGQGLPTIVQWTPYESTRERFISWGSVVFEPRLCRRGRRRAWTLRVRGRLHGVGARRPGRVRHRHVGRRPAVVERPRRDVGPELRCPRPVAAGAPRPPERPLHRTAGDPRRLLLGRVLDRRRLPARAHARRRCALDERHGADHRPLRPGRRPQRPHLRAPAADRARRGHDRAQGRLLAPVVGAPGERRVLAAVPSSPGEGRGADLPAGGVVRSLLGLASAQLRRDRRPGRRTGSSSGRGRTRPRWRPSPATSTSRRR